MSLPLPMPPLEMRELVGRPDERAFDNPKGLPVFGDAIELELYEAVLDFGCGCGRIARQLLQQTPRPKRYLGLDLHPGMIRWASNNLARDGFEFQHHDVYQVGFNPRTLAKTAPFPVGDQSVSLLLALSTFTHLPQMQCEYYLREAARVLRPDGVMLSTWFFFDKRDFPMMQEFQNTLYINDVDVSNATIFDRNWMIKLTSELGLTIRSIKPPAFRGFQWTLQLTRARVPAAPWPEDTAPIGRHPPPLTRQEDVSGVGLE